MGLKIFSSFISVLIIFLITFLTFFSNGESKLDYYSKFKIPDNGIFSISRDKNGGFAESIAKNDTQIYMERFDYLDKIFFNKKDSYKKNDKTSSIKVGNGKYLFSFSFPKRYEISGTGFKLSFVGPIKLYLNTENQGKLDVFSFNNIVDVSLLGLDDGKEKNKVYLYPHMFYPFDLLVNKVSVNIDFTRTLQLNPGIGYVNQNLFTSEFNLEEYKNLDNYFFRSIVNYFSIEYATSKTDESILNENFNNLRYDYIKKYFYIFVNDNKKISYYKDLIYMNLLKVYMSPKNSSGIFEDIQDYYDNLRKISEKDYIEMLKVLVYFKNKFILDNNIDSIETEEMYDEIMVSVYGYKKLEGNYKLYCIFNQYDLGKKEKFYEGLTSFNDDYFKTIGLKVEDDKISGSDDFKNIKLGYYIGFLENIIKSYLISNANIDNIKGPFNIFNKYALLSISVYENGKVDKKKTIILSNVELLKLLSDYIRNNFFEQELQMPSILVKKKELKIDSKFINQFNKSYNLLRNFYNKNKSILDEEDENDFIIMNDYDSLIPTFDEYLKALTNYDKYKHDKSKLSEVNTFSGSDDPVKLVYSVGDVVDYIKNFEGVDLDSIKVNADDKLNTYDVNVNIGNKSFYFELNPNNNFSITNIYIDGVKRSGTLNLNLIKENWDNKYNSLSDPEERSRYDFKKYFINTFLKIKSPTPIPDNPDTPGTPKEPTEILVFKRDKLLGPKGEFAYIKGFTDIKSENIIVENNNDIISIKLKDIKSEFTYNTGRESSIFGAYISADYHIGDNEHYFSNMKLKIYKISGNGDKNEEFGLGNGIELKVSGRVGINNYKDYMNGILGSYNSIVLIYNTLINKVNSVEISANMSKIVKYSFNFNGKNYEVGLLRSNIYSVKRDGENLIQTTFNYTDFPNRIDLLIK